MKYRKKPVVIEAWPWDDWPDLPGIVHRPIDTDQPNARCFSCDHSWGEHASVATLEGSHSACVGDWLIRGVKGEFYPCKPDIFEQTYEPVV